MEFIDTHCHLTGGELGRRADEVIARAAQAGVSRLIAVACVRDEWEAALELQRRHPGRIWVAAGIHPHEAAQTVEPDFNRLADVWRSPGVVAAGEMGLDYHYDFSPRDVQQRVFARQLACARELDVPIVIHCREAHEDVVRLLIEAGYGGRRVVFHCFSGTPAQAAELRDQGWWTSFTGVITFKKSADQQRACIETPLDALLFETDAPYLSPEPVRRMRPNEPCNLVHTARFAAQLRGESMETVADATTANAIRFFRLDARGESR